MQPQIVHEAEVHRQHVRLKIPIQVEIDGVRYQVDDWSMGGFGIESDITSRQPGERFPGRLTFPFEDFEIGIRLDCQMVYVLTDSRRFGCRFIALSRDQLALFRYLVDAYLSGEVVSAGDILHVRGRDNSAQARLQALAANPLGEEETTFRRVRRVAGWSLLVLLGIGLATAVGYGVRERFFTLEATTAVVETPLYRLRAPAAGVLEVVVAPETMVPTGEVVARIRTRDGQLVPIQSPCVCTLLEGHTLDGQFVPEGETAMVLVSAERPLSVRAELPVQNLGRLKVGDRAEIRIPGLGASRSGQIERIDLRPQFGLLGAEGATPVSRRLAQIYIRPDRPFELGDLGLLVEVRFP